MKQITSVLALAVFGTLLLLFSACNKSEGSANGKNAKLTGKITIDGSSTVFPITEAMAEEFRKEAPKVRIAVSFSGTGGGFKKFMVKETEISDASRIIKGKELKKAKENNIEFIELPVAFDGISVVIHKENTWAKSISTAELKKIWDQGSTVKTWKDVRSSWPNKEIKLFGPGTDSGTFDYFTHAINGKSARVRSEFTRSADPNILVKGVASDKYSMGFFGYAYYKENKDKLQALAIDNGKGAVGPSAQSINDGSYAPLSRPIFIYVRADVAKRADVKAFVEFYLKNAGKMVGQVGYVNLSAKSYEMGLKRFHDGKTGSAFKLAKKGQTIEEILASN